MKRILLIVIILVITSGCAEIKPPTPMDIIRQPLGTKTVKPGMSKAQVRQLWGEPDRIDFMGRDEMGLVKEKWIYRARYPEIPVESNYLSRTQYLFFDGDYLVRIKQAE